MGRFLMAVTARLPARAITRGNGEPYLERYYVGRLFGWTFYLHRFLASDDPHLHDHPWRLSVSLVLTGGYVETRCHGVDCAGLKTRQRWLRPGCLNIIRGGDFHRIDLFAGGAWTLFATRGARVKRWGFLSAVERSEDVDAGQMIDYVLVPAADAAHETWHLTAPTGAQMRLAGRL